MRRELFLQNGEVESRLARCENLHSWRKQVVHKQVSFKSQHIKTWSRLQESFSFRKNRRSNMRKSFPLSFVLIVVTFILLSTVQEGEMFGLTISRPLAYRKHLKWQARKLKLSERRTTTRRRVSSDILAKLTKILRKKLILKSKLQSLNRFLKKYEGKVRNFHYIFFHLVPF